MRLLRYGIAVSVLAGLGACSNMMGSSGPPARPATAAQPTVAPEMVRQVQSKLRDDGYYRPGPVDGVWGAGTEASVRSFQRDHNLPASGQLDMPTLHALNLASNTTTDTANNGPPPTQPNASPPSPAKPATSAAQH
jgi:peptidoglycan hydrolase-like protein with peptidoglycan-binding domain